MCLTGFPSGRSDGLRSAVVLSPPQGGDRPLPSFGESVSAADGGFYRPDDGISRGDRAAFYVREDEYRGTDLKRTDDSRGAGEGCDRGH